MILNRIHLQNIRSYVDQVIEFPVGTTLFAGDIGSGKSSILMGIEFALFGLGEQKGASLLSKGSNKGSVILEFETHGKKCQVSRSLLKNKNNSIGQDSKGSYLEEDGVRYPLTSSELKQRVLQLLRFNEPHNPRTKSVIFRYAVFTPQDEIKAIFSDPDKRLETFRRAFGIEEYRNAQDNVGPVSQKLNGMIIRSEERSKNLDAHMQKRTDTEDEINRIRGEISALQESVKERMTKKTGLENEIAGLKIQEMRVNELESKRQGYEANLRHNRSSAAKLKEEIDHLQADENRTLQDMAHLEKTKPPTMLSSEDLDSIAQRLHKAEMLRHDAESKIRDESSAIVQLKRRLGPRMNSDADALRAEYDKISMHTVGLKEEIDSTSGKISQLSSRRGSLDTVLQNSMESLRRIAQLGTKCPTCYSDITQARKDKLIRDLQHEADEAERQISSVQEEIKQFQNKKSKTEYDMEANRRTLDSLSRDMDHVVELSSRIKSMQEAHDKLASAQESSSRVYTEFPGLPMNSSVDTVYALKNELFRYTNSQTQLNHKRENLAKMRTTIDEKRQELASTQEMISQIESSIGETNRELGKIAGVSTRMADLQRTKDELYDAINEDKQLISSHNAALSIKNDQLKQYDEEIGKARMYREKNRMYTSYKRWLEDYFTPAVKMIEKTVMLSIQQQFNEIYRRWYSILIEDPSKDTRIDENFTPIVEQDGYEQSVDFLSGGEKTGVALAYRLALNTVMRKETDSDSNLLILDEPTDGFSKSQLYKMKDILNEINAEQVILVSHESELETFADTVFTISKESGKSVVSRM